MLNCRVALGNAAARSCPRRGPTHRAAAPASVTCEPRRSCAAASTSSGAPSSTSTLSLSVYIEDTDHYQVAFYANYFKWFQRAREAALGAEAFGLLRAQQLQPVLLAAEKTKYNSAARLGDAVDLVSTVSRHTPKSLRWQQAAAPAAAASSGASAKPFVAGEIVLGFARADGSLADVPEALLAMAAPSQGPEPADGAWKPLAPYKDLKPVSVTEIRVFSDEVSPWGCADEVAILRWFERNRTDSIGGAAGLRALETTGVLVVVTGVNDLRIDPAARVVAGDVLSVRSGVELRAKNQFIIFKQELWRGKQLVAHGEVACAGIDAATMKLAPCPADLAQRLTTPLAQ